MTCDNGDSRSSSLRRFGNGARRRLVPPLGLEIVKRFHSDLWRSWALMRSMLSLPKMRSRASITEGAEEEAQRAQRTSCEVRALREASTDRSFGASRPARPTGFIADSQSPIADNLWNIAIH